MTRTIEEIKADLKRLGDEFNACTDNEYITIDDDIIQSKKEMLGDQIFWLYAELGRAIAHD